MTGVVPLSIVAYHNNTLGVLTTKAYILSHLPAMLTLPRYERFKATAGEVAIILLQSGILNCQI